MRDEEIVVTGCFEWGIDGHGGVTPRVASGFEGGVKVTKVGLVDVEGCQVGDDAEPPCEDGRFWVGIVIVAGRGWVVRTGLREGRVEDFKVAVVGMNARDAWVAWVDNETETGCEKGEALVDVFKGCVSCAHLLDGSGWENAVYGRDVDAGFFDRMIICSLCGCMTGRAMASDGRREGVGRTAVDRCAI